MSDIFISYAQEDRGKAKDIADALKQQGFSVWWDRSILPGERFAIVIEKALDAAKCVIVLWSHASVSSDWVNAEASKGRRKRILIPVLIERDVEMPLAFSRLQAADLRDWDGKLPHHGFDNLLKAVAGILGRPLPVQSGHRMEPEIVQPSVPRKMHSSILEKEEERRRKSSEYKYQVALSFAGEDREHAEKLANILKKGAISVFYDSDEQADLWGKDLYQHLQSVYRDEAQFCVVFVSQAYAKKLWPRHELKQAQARAFMEQQEYILPVRVDDTEIPGISETTGYIDLRSTPVEEIANLVIQKLSLSRTKLFEQNYLNIEEKNRKVYISQETEKLAKRGNSIGMKFTLIPAGEFFMGSEKNSWEKPVHKVKITSAFYLGTYPVTPAEWKAVMRSKPSYFKVDDLPVDNVSWNNVQKFIRKLNEKEGTDKYRLPSEAEWEYACRAGTTTRYSFGDDESKLGDYAWYSDNSDGKTHPVGQKKPNPYGLYDMYGNVWEWVQDTWHESYDGAPADGSAWERGGGAYRVDRGGGWKNFAKFCRSAARHYRDPRYRGYNLGFRLLREL